MITESRLYVNAIWPVLDKHPLITYCLEAVTKSFIEGFERIVAACLGAKRGWQIKIDRIDYP
jgi:hypothetical protein